MSFSILLVCLLLLSTSLLGQTYKKAKGHKDLLNQLKKIQSHVEKIASHYCSTKTCPPPREGIKKSKISVEFSTPGLIKKSRKNECGKCTSFDTPWKIPHSKKNFFNPSPSECCPVWGHSMCLPPPCPRIDPGKAPFN